MKKELSNYPIELAVWINKYHSCLGYVYSVKKWDSTIILLSMYHILTKVNNKLMTHKIKGHKEKIKKKDQEERNGKLSILALVFQSLREGNTTMRRYQYLLLTFLVCHWILISMNLNFPRCLVLFSNNVICKIWKIIFPFLRVLLNPLVSGHQSIGILSLKIWFRLWKEVSWLCLW